MDAAGFAARYDAMIESPPMRALYRDSGYFNVGYWPAGTTDIVEACDRLVDELASRLPPDASVIVDVGCGVGAATRRLADRFPGARILAVNISYAQLLRARRRGVAAPVVMDATRLAIASGVADAVVALESAQHFDTRAAFLDEAFRVLRPGGTLALADMLFHDAEPAGLWLLPPANRGPSRADYKAALAAAGFTAIDVRDTTELCWQPYCAALRAVYPDDPGMVAALEASLSHYVLVSARKPGVETDPDVSSG
jgi:SAM-dependent methyltransferase